MNKEIILSIIVPVYNVEGFIERFLKSIIPQLNIESELIIVDDKGSDNSINIATSLLANTSVNYQLVTRLKNGGLSAARNSGIEVAKGHYYYFADSDDLLEEGTISEFFKIIAEFPNVSFFCFNASYKNVEEYDFRRWRETGVLARNMSGNKLLEALYDGKIGAYIWQFLFKRELFDQTKFKEGSVWEDSIILPQLLTDLDNVICLEDIFIYKYILRAGSITQSVHPQIDQVVNALNEVEIKLYPTKEENLYFKFVLFRTGLTMRLSRECFVRTRDYKRLMQIHKGWGMDIPINNISTLWKNNKKKSAVFLYLIKNYPPLLYLMYQCRILK